MSVKLLDRGDVQDHIERMALWWNDLTLDDVLLDGQKIDVQLESAITGHSFKRSIVGPPTLDLSVHDGDRRILREILPKEDEFVLDVAGHDYAFAQVRKAGGSLTLTFEAEVAAWLKRYRKYLKAYRNTVTRAQFVQMMLRQVREGTINFYCPDLRERQPIARATSKPSVGKRGLTKSDEVKVKGDKASEEQLRTLEAALDRCVELKVPRRAWIAVVAASIQENDATNQAGGDRDSTRILQQRKSMGWEGDLDKIATQVYNFLKRTPAGIDPFVQVLKEHPGKSIGWQIDQVQRSRTYGTTRQGVEYQRWVGEAQKIVKAYGSGIAATRQKRYAFTRGEPGRPESTWAAGVRLSEEVRWRFFVDGQTVFYLDDADLRAAAKATTLTEETPGVSIDFDYDYGKKAQTAQVQIVGAVELMPGLAVKIADCGRADGTYIVEEMSRSGELTQTLQLVRPAPERKEPAAETVDVQGRGGSESKASGWVQPLATMPAASGKFGEQRSGHLHGGIDYPVSVGTNVRSVASGTVTHAGSEGGYGTSVVVKHSGGYSTRYAHLSSARVRSGQKVSAGDSVGKSGNTGNSSGPHLHFELVKDGRRVCPSSKVPGISKGLCVRESI